MEAKAIAVINGQEILAFEGTVPMIAVKPICTALGVNPSSQYRKIQCHEILKGECCLCYSRSKNGKMYKMLCLPEYYILGWLWSINPKNVSSEAKKKALKNQRECFDKLVEYFKLKKVKRNEN